jgi:site-specific DNA-methyltransferase (adenine-specific)
MEINKIYNEPCLDTIRNMTDDFIHLTITSPPYNLGEKHHTRDNVFNSYDTYNDNLDENIYQEEQIKVLNEIYRATKEGGSLMYNHKNRIKNGLQITPYEWLLKTKWTIKQELVWQNGTPNMDKCRFYPSTERIYWLSKGIKTTFFNTTSSNDLIKDMPVGTSGEHKRAFPLKLAQRFIICFPDSEIIYDPYMGSGTTAIACIKEKRNYIGSEISKDYCELANIRIEREKSQLLLF